MKYTHIVFDLDGTLLDNEAAIILSLQETIQALCGYTPKAEDLTFSLGIPGTETLKIFPIDDVPAALALWIKHLNAHGDMVAIFSDMQKTLEHLQSLGYQLGIVTSKTRQEFEVDFPRFGLSAYFGTVICAEDTTEHKPLPAPMYKYMELTNTTSQNLLYIGDSIYDMHCALKAGVEFALAGWGARRQTGALTILHTHSAILDLISKKGHTIDSEIK